MTPSRIRILPPLLVATTLGLASLAPQAQERIDGVIQQRGAFGRSVVPDEFFLVHDSEFKGAKRVAISVFNVAFPSENRFTAINKGTSILGGVSTGSATSFSSTMKGVDPATQQRLADKALALFIERLKSAGYEVVDGAELARLAPEINTWETQPGFSAGRYGAYVAPTGMAVRFLPGDTAKRDTSGAMGGFAAFRALDRTQAFLRSPYLAHDANLGIIAVTLVLDYGVYSTSGYSGRLYGSSQVGFKPGVTMGAGNHVDSGSLINYWGPNSGGFPAQAFLQRPVISTKPFATRDEDRDAIDPAAALTVNLTADALKFEDAATEVLATAIPKLVAVMSGGR